MHKLNKLNEKTKRSYFIKPLPKSFINNFFYIFCSFHYYFFNYITFQKKSNNPKSNNPKI